MSWSPEELARMHGWAPYLVLAFQDGDGNALFWEKQDGLVISGADSIGMPSEIPIVLDGRPVARWRVIGSQLDGNVAFVTVDAAEGLGGAVLLATGETNGA